MKVKSYEKMRMMKLLIAGILILELIFFFLLYTHKEFNYKKVNGIVIKDNIMALVLSKEERQLLYKSSYLLMNDKLKKYIIVEDNGVFIKKDTKNYYEIIIKVKFDKKYKKNDTIEINLKNNKYRVIEMFKLIWRGV